MSAATIVTMSYSGPRADDTSRKVIDTAVGVLVGLRGCPPEEAFGEIVRVLLQQTRPQLFDIDELRAATWNRLMPPPLGGAQGLSDVPKYTNLFWMYLMAGVTVVFAFRLK